jgi:hypothetical protein
MIPYIPPPRFHVLGLTFYAFGFLAAIATVQPSARRRRTPWYFDATADARRFIVAENVGEDTPLPVVLIQNWTARLRR